MYLSQGMCDFGTSNTHTHTHIWWVPNTCEAHLLFLFLVHLIVLAVLEQLQKHMLACLENICMNRCMYVCMYACMHEKYTWPTPGQCMYTCMSKCMYVCHVTHGRRIGHWEAFRWKNTLQKWTMQLLCMHTCMHADTQNTDVSILRSRCIIRGAISACRMAWFNSPHWLCSRFRWWKRSDPENSGSNRLHLKPCAHYMPTIHNFLHASLDEFRVSLWRNWVWCGDLVVMCAGLHAYTGLIAGMGGKKGEKKEANHTWSWHLICFAELLSLNPGVRSRCPLDDCSQEAVRWREGVSTKRGVKVRVL